MGLHVYLDVPFDQGAHKVIVQLYEADEPSQREGGNGMKQNIVQYLQVCVKT